MKNKRSESDFNYKVVSLFEEIADRYDLLNRLLSFGIDTYWRKKFIKLIGLKKNKIVLDIGAGTFEVCKLILKQYPEIITIGLDLSLNMMLVGKKKIKNNLFLPVCGDGRKIPLKDESVDYVTISFGLRNIYPREEAYKEVLRILVEGGLFCILEFGSTQKSIMGGIYNYYLTNLVPKIASFFSKKDAYEYLAKSIFFFPTSEKLKKELLKAGFRKVKYKPISFGIVWIYIAEK